MAVIRALSLLAVTAVVSSCSGGSNSASRSSISETAASSSPSTTLASEVRVGARLVTGGGNEITVYAVQDPALATSPTLQRPDAGLQYAVADIEVCARQASGATFWTEAMFSLQTPDNRRWGPQAKAEVPVPPPFGSPRLAVGQCARGWVTFQAPVGQPVTRVMWTDLSGTSPPLTWLV